MVIYHGTEKKNHPKQIQDDHEIHKIQIHIVLPQSINTPIALPRVPQDHCCEPIELPLSPIRP